MKPIPSRKAASPRPPCACSKGQNRRARRRRQLLGLRVHAPQFAAPLCPTLAIWPPCAPRSDSISDLFLRQRAAQTAAQVGNRVTCPGSAHGGVRSAEALLRHPAPIGIRRIVLAAGLQRSRAGYADATRDRRKDRARSWPHVEGVRPQPPSSVISCSRGSIRPGASLAPSAFERLPACRAPAKEQSLFLR